LHTLLSSVSLHEQSKQLRLLHCYKQDEQDELLVLIHLFLFEVLGSLFADPLTLKQSLQSVWCNLFYCLYLILLLPLQDRKSTRLNSSHVSISYAVFCLKKKKKKHYRNLIARA